MTQPEPIEYLLPEGHVSDGFVVTFKVLDPDGDVCTMTTYSENITAWEAYGMLEMARMRVKQDMKYDED